MKCEINDKMQKMIKEINMYYKINGEMQKMIREYGAENVLTALFKMSGGDDWGKERSDAFIEYTHKAFENFKAEIEKYYFWSNNKLSEVGLKVSLDEGLISQEEYDHWMSLK